MTLPYDILTDFRAATVLQSSRLLIILMVAIMYATSTYPGNTGAGGVMPAATPETANTTAAGPAVVGRLNQSVSDRDLSFTVSEVRCGVHHVSDASGFMVKDALGQYCLVNVAVKNTGTNPQQFDARSQKLIGASEERYLYDATATTYYSNDSDKLLGLLNPGTSGSEVLVFDIPDGPQPVMVELHQNDYSLGAKVAL